MTDVEWARCKGCNEPIEQDAWPDDDNVWHYGCWINREDIVKCRDCGENIDDDTYFSGPKGAKHWPCCPCDRPDNPYRQVQAEFPKSMHEAEYKKSPEDMHPVSTWRWALLYLVAIAIYFGFTTLTWLLLYNTPLQPTFLEVLMYAVVFRMAVAFGRWRFYA